MAGLVLTSPEDVCNAALVRIGYRRPIGNLYEGSEASQAFLRIYGQTRDALLRLEDWGFAERFVAGTPSGSAPFPWTEQYEYPSDALKIRQLFSETDYSADENNPAPVNWRVGNATISGTQAQVIWADIASATIVYTGQVTNPQLWEPLFVEALIANLARRVLPALKDSPDMVKLAAEDEMAEEKAADQVQG